MRIASVVQRHDHVREQARELAVRHGDVALVNIVFPDTVLWADELSDERVHWLVRWAQCMLARATLAVGGQVRRDFVEHLEFYVDGTHSRVEALSRASARAMPYLREEVRQALTSLSPASLVLTTTFELDGAVMAGALANNPRYVDILIDALDRRMSQRVSIVVTP